MTEPVPGPRRVPPPSLVVVGVLAPEGDRADEATVDFAESYGGVVLRGEALPFDHTDYYEAEHGPNLVRRFCACADLLSPERLGELKARAWEVEQRYQRDGRRTVNLDPGLLDHTKLVLASFKPGPQKLYLGDGVWADTLLYRTDGAYGALPWTFPDLKDAVHLKFFEQARLRYKAALRGGN